MEPKYKMIARDLAAGFPARYRSGTVKLPSEEELMAQYHCSRQTVRSALLSLQQQHKIVKRRGSGSYLVPGTDPCGQIAVVLPDSETYIYPEICTRLSEVLEPAGFSVRCYASHGQPLTELRILEQLLRQPPAGILLAAADPELRQLSAPLFDALRRQKTPLLFWNSPVPAGCAAGSLQWDYLSGLHLLLERLSHRKDAPIRCLLMQRDWGSRQLYEAVLQTALEQPLPLDEHSFCWLSPEELDSPAGMERFLTYHFVPGCTVLCIHDRLAYQLIRRLLEQGIAVPKEAGVFAFENSYYSTRSSPAISALGIDRPAAAALAAELLLDIIAGKPPVMRLLPFRLSLRQSG